MGRGIERGPSCFHVQRVSCVVVDFRCWSLLFIVVVDGRRLFEVVVLLLVMVFEVIVLLLVMIVVDLVVD